MFQNKTIRSTLIILKDYCLNSSLAGLSYIADERYHITERIFWLLCITFSSFGSYHLIKEYCDTFESNSISMVLEDVRPKEIIEFPSIGACELGYSKHVYQQLLTIINNMKKAGDTSYNYDIEDFLLRVVFQNLYNFGSLSPYCAPYMDCDDCSQCPTDHYQEFSDAVRANCTELFEKCQWNGQEFDCCKYFLPLKTTMGRCFLINSIHTTNKNNPNWFNMELGWNTGNGLLELDFKNAIAVHVLNEEDVPHMILTSLQFLEQHEGFEATIQLHLQNIVNDPEIRHVHPIYRRCIFPDEIPKNLIYEHYSFSTCVTECLKEAQINICNCTHYNMIIDDSDNSTSCNYDGLLCLDTNDLMYPQTTIMQPWRTNGLVCPCLPSCNEHEIRIVEKSYRLNENEKNRSISISLQSLPTQRYRRQAVRGKLDMVVSIGGILGLFMGASILSGVELVYFFTARIIGNFSRQSNQ